MKYFKLDVYVYEREEEDHHQQQQKSREKQGKYLASACDVFFSLSFMYVGGIAMKIHRKRMLVILFREK